MAWTTLLILGLTEAVNDAYNDQLIKKEDYKTLRDLIDSFDNFDNISSVKRVERRELLEFRRLAERLYKARVWYTWVDLLLIFAKENSLGGINITSEVGNMLWSQPLFQDQQKLPRSWFRTLLISATRSALGMKDTEYIPYLSDFHAEMLELTTTYVCSDGL